MDFSTICIKIVIQTRCRIFETWGWRWDGTLWLETYMLKQYRLHCSWTLHISCEHLYNSMYKLPFITLENMQIWSLFANANSALLEHNDHALRIQNTFCFEVLSSLNNSNKISFKYLVDWSGFKFLLVFKAC